MSIWLLKGAFELSAFCNGSVLQLSAEGTLEQRPKECRDKIHNIERWSDAFLIYASIYHSTRRDKVQEILH